MSHCSAGGLLAIAAGAGPADWVVTGLRGHTYDAGSIVPATFEAYVRAFHPAGRAEGDAVTEVRWAEVAQADGRVMHPAAERGSITGSWDYQYRKSQPGLWDYPPHTGELPATVATRLAALLADFTSAPGRCWSAVWEGWADLAHQWDPAPRFDIPGRRMLLLVGAGRGGGRLPRRPATGRPFRQLVVATRPRLVRRHRHRPDDHLRRRQRPMPERLLTEAALETLPVSADQRVTWDSDTINPQPPAPH